ncbi:MAG: PQQ-dependent sugar dehydrogenase [Candidatus Paceibacterota bacterium]
MNTTLRKSRILLFIILLGAIGLFFYLEKKSTTPQTPSVVTEVNENREQTTGTEETSDIPEIEKEPKVILTNLTVPWDFVFLPDGGLLISERDGTLLYKDTEQELHEISIPETKQTGESGLLGIMLHPDFKENNLLYVYLTTETETGLINRVERYRFSNGELTQKEIILDRIPGARYHDGGRIAFGPDQMLYIATGDAQNEESAQNPELLSGKILRVTDTGDIPSDNPFGNEVYSMGHRNPQGITWDDKNRLWITEHGRSGVLSGFDEVNLITKGGNYGWPESEGDTVLPNTVKPKAHSGASATWAPASALYWDGSIFFGGLRGVALFEAVLENETVVEVREHYKSEFGRIRTITLGPDGYFYLSTSNRDGRGPSIATDDRIIRIHPSIFRE